MKKTLIGTSLISLGFLVSCSSGTFDSIRENVEISTTSLANTTTSTRFNESNVSLEDAFIFYVKDNDPLFSSVPNELLLDIGHTICDIADLMRPDAEAFLIGIYEAFRSADVPTETSALVSVSAITLLCPQHWDWLDPYLDGGA